MFWIRHKSDANLHGRIRLGLGPLFINRYYLLRYSYGATDTPTQTKIIKDPFILYILDLVLVRCSITYCYSINPLSQQRLCYRDLRGFLGLLSKLRLTMVWVRLTLRKEVWCQCNGLSVVTDGVTSSCHLRTQWSVFCILWKPSYLENS